MYVWLGTTFTGAFFFMSRAFPRSGLLCCSCCRSHTHSVTANRQKMLWKNRFHINCVMCTCICFQRKTNTPVNAMRWDQPRKRGEVNVFLIYFRRHHRAGAALHKYSYTDTLTRACIRISSFFFSFLYLLKQQEIQFIFFFGGGSGNWQLATEAKFKVLT